MKWQWDQSREHQRSATVEADQDGERPVERLEARGLAVAGASHDDRGPVNGDWQLRPRLPAELLGFVFALLVRVTERLADVELALVHHVAAVPGHVGRADVVETSALPRCP